MPPDEPYDYFVTALSGTGRGWFNRWGGPHSNLYIGTLLIGGDIISDMGVLCSVEPTPQWRRQIPRFICHEKWMKRGDDDWHAYQDASLCLDVAARWRDVLAVVGERLTLEKTARYAAEYLLNSAAWLITRHRYAYENGLTKWPPSWRYWAHGPRGETDYLKEPHVLN